MRVTTTISPGPRSTDLERLDQEIESHPIWTELRGPVNYYLLDSIGTILGTTDGTGSRDASYYYAPFGDTTTATGSASATSNRFGFAGGWLDPTGMYHYGQRYYSPTLGRWTQPDPNAGTIDAPKNINRYLYTGDDPINHVDVNGESLSPLAQGFLGFGGGSALEAGGLLTGGAQLATGALAFGLAGLAAASFAVGLAAIGCALFC